jgi:hypothetical protein
VAKKKPRGATKNKKRREEDGEKEYKRRSRR